ncbi:helix-turn-helix domain-containing protein [Croceivirga sp. JEA036]|uniref:helix-turn-helix domain-containing protein n=1 Tax=Croceivirga sp. JEA036 TaxID=2721162 RepID=UPI001439D071|nr:helix-turn-helix transcriptional regulator [Croceivirga sp. JEA036]NJB37671.1 helix-turn-helix transcriptional regulator [Croceivirga sp. JEA036]
MSSFGKNIKKIRKVRNLSQQAFAGIFNLKRATLGAYEEERSEPKIDTIIKIANYFSIPIDDLLTKELTVNALLKFKGDLTTDTHLITKTIFPEIDFVTERLMSEYPFSFEEEEFIKHLPKIQLPIYNSELCRAFTVVNLEMTNNARGFYPNDIIIAERVPLTDPIKITNGLNYVAVTADRIIFRKLYQSKKEFVLRADHKNLHDIILHKEDLKELWNVKYVFCKRIPDFSNMVEAKLNLIQQDLAKLQEHLR